MNKNNTGDRQDMKYKTGCILVIFAILFSGCSAFLPSTVSLINPGNPSIEFTEADFVVSLPEGKTINGFLILEILDEVTGLPFNPQRYPLIKVNDTQYGIKVSLPVHSLVKYRFRQQTDTLLQEVLPDGRLMRYRVAKIEQNQKTVDQIYGWENEFYEVVCGEAKGTIVDSVSKKPISGLIVSIAGNSDLTTSSGSFILHNVPIGLQNLVVFSPDGRYETYQQGAIIAQNAITFADLELFPGKDVTVTWIIQPPSMQNLNQRIRLTGDLIQMGNTFTDLAGGVSTSALLAPEFQVQSDGSYRLDLKLPSGAFINYKYSLGDGFWNAEHAPDGSFLIHRLLVPDHDLIIQESVNSWEVGEYQPIHFQIQVPESTPAYEQLTIQFNPFGWLEPIPMWYSGNQTWEYTLYSPLNWTGNIGFRICRNGICEAATELTAVSSNQLNSFVPSNQEQFIQYKITDWKSINHNTLPTYVTTSQFQNKENSFVAGIELNPILKQTWVFNANKNLGYLNEMQPNTILFSPIWATENSAQPLIRPDMAVGLRDDQLIDLVAETQRLGINAGMFPKLYFPDTVDMWWEKSNRDAEWWSYWYAQYEEFVLHYAHFAAENNVKMLILGGREIYPALPKGRLFDGSLSGTPDATDQFWMELINNIRKIYTGDLAFAVPYPYQFEPVPSFVDQFDCVYIEWKAPLLNDSEEFTISELTNDFNRALVQDIQILKETIQKRIILGFGFPAMDGSKDSCMTDPDKCNIGNWMTLGYADEDICHPNFSAQADIYNAILIAVNQNSWLDGIVIQDYFLPASLQDCTASVNGKPARSVIWHWYANW